MIHDDAVRRERAHVLMMAALDGESTAAERQELDQLLAAAPDLAAEWQRFTRLKEVTTDMSLSHPPEEIWDHYWQSTYRRAERGVAWILVSIGAVVLGAYGLWHAAGALIRDTSMPVSIRLAIAALAVGGLILLVSVVREKVFTGRRDPYQKGVIR